MAQTVVTLYNPISFLIKSTTDASFTLLTANFTTGVVSSSLLSSRATTVLTERLQAMLAAAPTRAAIENGFAGLVRGLVVCQCFEASSFAVQVTYASPTATYTLAGLPATAHIAVSIPHSVSAPVIGNP